MKYKCLVFDHDDTTVNSTATIHHPAFLDFLGIYYPGRTCTLEEYFLKNFSPGFVQMCVSEYGMTEHDLEVETQFWLDHVKNHIPSAYPGIREIMERQKSEGHGGNFWPRGSWPGTEAWLLCPTGDTEWSVFSISVALQSAMADCL